MIFKSTRNENEIVNFKTAIFNGLASDGGLYYLAKKLDLSEIFKSFYRETPFNKIATDTMYGILSDELSYEQCESIINKAFNFEPKLVKTSSGISILELFHGPSSAFKDFGASFLASTMEEFLKTEKLKTVILTATSGDTGSAVAQAFYDKKNIDVVILYPSKRVSPLQEKQLTTLGKNIHALEVLGSFDDCQRMVKDAFQSKLKINLSSANSINLGRLLPQSFYYIWAYAQQKKSKDDIIDNLVFTVPSGNFGNLTAALLAKSWGLPVKHFVAATNENDIVPKYLVSGNYQPKASIQTLSNAMDVGSPSNFERMLKLFKDYKDMGENISGIKVTDAETLETISKMHEVDKMFICPHTAVGYFASKKYLSKNKNDNIISLATAAPAKFLEIVEQATSFTPDLPPNLAAIKDKEKVSTIIENNSKALENFLLKKF